MTLGDRPRRYIDARGFAEESIGGDVGRYRLGSGIVPPETSVNIDIDGVVFDIGTSNQIRGLPQLGDLSFAGFRGYGGELVDQQVEYSWQEVDLSCFSR